MTNRKRTYAAAIVTVSFALAGCSSTGSDQSTPSASSLPAVSASASPEPIPAPTVVVDGAPTAVVTDQSEVIGGLDAPWDLEFMPDGSMLISERDTAHIERVRSGFATALNGPGAEALRGMVDADGEGGLLGLALSPTDHTTLYAYISRAGDNAVVRMSLTGDLLSAPVDVVAGIPHATRHNGGRIEFGPDGYLYISTGDSSDGDLAQDPTSLAGKILRVVADGSEDDGTAPSGNPSDSIVWSLGHRNVEGFGWTGDGRMYASEFGNDSTDELNLIQPGANYGWPTVEATQGAPAGTALGDTVGGLTYPAVEWAVADASPSGIAITEDAIYIAALRGEGVWRIPLTQDGVGTPALLNLDLGRIRDVEVGTGGDLYVVTNNTDGRGEPREGDDHVYKITVS